VASVKELEILKESLLIKIKEIIEAIKRIFLKESFVLLLWANKIFVFQN